MPLPVVKASVEAAPTTVGGLPAVAYDIPPQTIFEIVVAGRWARQGWDGLPFDALAIGTAADIGGSITPDLPDGSSTDTGLALPITPTIDGQPTRADVPGAWQSLGPQLGGPQFGAPVPLPPEITLESYTQGDDVWLRFLTTVPTTGQTVALYLYLPTGIPTAVGAEVTAWVAADEQDFQLLTIPTAALAEGEASDPVTVTFENVVGSPPAPRKAVAIAQGRNDVPLTVEGVEDGTPIPVAVVSGDLGGGGSSGPVTVVTGDTPIAVTGDEGGPVRSLIVGGEGDPLPVAATVATPLLVRSVVSATGTPGAPARLAIPLPFVRIEVSGGGPAPGGGATSTARLICGSEYELIQIPDGRWGDPTPSGAFRPLVLEAPAGTQINDDSHVDATIDSADPEATVEIAVIVYALGS